MIVSKLLKLNMRGDNMDDNKPKEEAITLDEALDEVHKMQVALSPYGKLGAYGKFFGMTDEEIREECRKSLRLSK